MRTYILGAGASCDAGYPFAKSMGSKLSHWMRNHDDVGCFSFRAAAAALDQKFGALDDIEELLSRVDEFRKSPAAKDPASASIFNHDEPALVEGIRQWFSEIREGQSSSYEFFATGVVQAGDCVITFNYDVSLDRQLQLAKLWHLGDGYGFQVEQFPVDSPVEILKLHGSVSWLTRVPIQGLRGRRLIFARPELDYLGYTDRCDPLFPPQGAAAISPMILPTRCKKFSFSTSFGERWKDFWDHLWNKAAEALRRSEKIVICGYSLPLVDGRACDLLLNPGYSLQNVEVCSGEDSKEIVERLLAKGHVAKATDQRYFADWVRTQATSA